MHNIPVMDFAAAKSGLRHEAKRKLAEFQNLEYGSECMVKRLLDSEIYATASNVVGFLPIQKEPLLVPVLRDCIESGRRLFLPSYSCENEDYSLSEVGGLDEKWLEKGRYGILEPRHDLPAMRPPFHFSDRTIWLVPGLAFSSNGARLGRGGGYYDRLLHCSDGVKVGVLFQCQILNDIPQYEYDMNMDFLLTENELAGCSI